jgi:Cu(I)/Ag(I) efflux system membrane protein CusA/SilA
LLSTRQPGAPILWASGIGSDVDETPIAAHSVGRMITSTIHVLILVPVFFVMMNERALKIGTSSPPVIGRRNTQAKLRT